MCVCAKLGSTLGNSRVVCPSLYSGLYLVLGSRLASMRRVRAGLLVGGVGCVCVCAILSCHAARLLREVKGRC